MGPSRIKFPYRARILIKDAPEAIEFCLRTFGPCYSEGYMVTEVMRRKVPIRQNVPCWWFEAKQTVAKFFFINPNDLIRFNIVHGYEPGYKVSYEETDESPKL